MSAFFAEKGSPSFQRGEEVTILCFKFGPLRSIFIKVLAPRKQSMISNKKFWLYILAYFLWFGALGAYFPYATLFLSEYVGIALGTIFFFWGMVSLAQALFVPPFGVLADRCGKRPVLCLTLSLFIVTLLLSLAVSAKWLQIILFLLQGVFVGAISSHLDAQCLEEACSESTRPFGFIRAAGTLGWCVTNLVLFYLFPFTNGAGDLPLAYLLSSFLLVFFLFLFLDLRGSFQYWSFGAIPSLFSLKNTSRGLYRSDLVNTFIEHFGQIPLHTFMSFFFPIFLIGFSYSSVMLVLPPYIETRGFGVSTLAGSVSFGSLLEILLFPLATMLAALLSPVRLAAYGGLLLTIRAWAVNTAVTPEVLILAFFLTHSTGFALYTTGSTLTVNTLASPHQRAFYQSLVTAFGWKAAQSAAAFVSFFFTEWGASFESVLWIALIAGFVGTLLLYFKEVFRHSVL